MTHKYIEDIDKSYISDYDLFLKMFDQKHPLKSASQQAEIEKHRRIAEKRDNPSYVDDVKDSSDVFI